MMTQTLHQQLTDLTQQCDQARQTGDVTQEAELQQEVALRLVLLNEFSQAKKRLRRALKLNQRQKHPLAEAKTRYILGMTEARSNPNLKESLAYFEQALPQFQGLAEWVMVGRTQIYLATLTLWQGFQQVGQQWLKAVSPEVTSPLKFQLPTKQFQVVETHLEAAIGAFSKAEDVNRLLDSLRYRIVVLLLQGKTQAAFQNLSQALQVARQYGREAELLQLQLDVYNLSSLATENPQLNSISEILSQANQTGQEKVAAYAHLTQARELLRLNRIEEAIDVGQATRQIALSKRDPTLYLLACLLLAEGEEQRQNRLAVLNVLFTCQASLGQLLGDEAKVPVLLVIDSLKQRWGEAEFINQMNRYRSQFSQEQ